MSAAFDHSRFAAAPSGAPITQSVTLSLGDQRRGFAGLIAGLRFDTVPAAGGVPTLELERRLLEMGFVEGARVEILHEGLIGRDPIAVRLDDMRVALRRQEARCVMVEARAIPRTAPRTAR